MITSSSSKNRTVPWAAPKLASLPEVASQPSSGTIGLSASAMRPVQSFWWCAPKTTTAREVCELKQVGVCLTASLTISTILSCESLDSFERA